MREQKTSNRDSGTASAKVVGSGDWLGLRRIFRKPIGKCLYLFPRYTRWLGMPLYVTARKLGLPKYAAMMSAHTPGALFHANLWLLKPHIGLIIVAASYAIFPAIYWTGHKCSKPNESSSPTVGGGSGGAQPKGTK
jgi:hypothetical protein